MIARTQPGGVKEITKNAQAFERLFFNGLRDCAIKTDADHHQKIAPVDAAEINTARLPMQQHVARTGIIKRNAHFARPYIDGAGRDDAQRGFASSQGLDDFVDGAVATHGNYYVGFLFYSSARQLLRIAGPLRVTKLDPPALAA